MTLLPAALAFAGVHLERFRIRRVTPRPAEEGAWSRLAWWVMRRPVAVLVPTLALLLALGTPFLHVRFNAPDARILPEDAPSRDAFDRLTEAFGPGPFAPIVIAVRTTGPVLDPVNLAALFDSLEAKTEYFWDTMHPNEKGSALIARALFDRIEELKSAGRL